MNLKYSGCKEDTQKVDYIYCEVNRGEMCENNAMVEELDEYLGKYNFQRESLTIRNMV